MALLKIECERGVVWMANVVADRKIACAVRMFDSLRIEGSWDEVLPVIRSDKILLIKEVRYVKNWETLDQV